MEILGFLSEIIFLAMAIYLYLFATGKVNAPNAKNAQKSNAFRDKNKGWLKIASLALIAMNGLNLFLHIQSVFTK